MHDAAAQGTNGGFSLRVQPARRQYSRRPHDITIEATNAYPVNGALRRDV